MAVGREAAGMAKWLQSGLRRDICIVVADRGNPTGHDVKRAIERHYDETVRPKTFRGAMSELVKTGHLTSEVDGVHDRYSLTVGGERRLREQFEWMRARLSALEGEGSTTEDEESTTEDEGSA
jgi:DNA-binding PadR family transcriptional regulator